MKWTSDFETTNDKNDCRVWAAGIYEIGSDNFKYWNCLDDFMSFILKCKNDVFYFHNLKFDGEFIFYWLFENNFKHTTDNKLNNNEFKSVISDTGQFYNITIKYKSNQIKIIDSLKILPFSVDYVSKAFNLDIKKLNIDYNKKREKGYNISKEEIEYLKNDVNIMSQALFILNAQNLPKNTQASNAFFDFKNLYSKDDYNTLFPVLTYEIDKDIRLSYRGGYTYLKDNIRYNDKLRNNVKEGIVLDINSLYPSVMYDSDLPYGNPVYFNGEYKEDEIYPLYIQKIKVSFKVKDNFLPFITDKSNRYTTSIYLSESIEKTIFLTNAELKLFIETHEIYDIEYISGWKFKKSNTLFKSYIDKWMKIKIEAEKTGNKAMRTIAKLMMNALYGRFGLNPNLISKIPYYENGLVCYKFSDKTERESVYLPIACFITSYARCKIILNGNMVFDRFLYSDTDSLHLKGYNLPNCLEIDKYKLGSFKLEYTFCKARFIQPKRYIEMVNASTDCNVSKRFLNVVCASLPHKCHKYVTWTNFKVGHKFRGKLMQKRVKGGVILEEKEFTLR